MTLILQSGYSIKKFCNSWFQLAEIVYNKFKEVKFMLKRIIQACFLIAGGTLGIFLMPQLLIFIHLQDYTWINNPYVAAVFGAIIFYIISFWAVDHVVHFVKWFEETLVKTPVTDIIF